MWLCLVVAAATAAAPVQQHVAVPRIAFSGVERDTAAQVGANLAETLAAGGGLQVSTASFDCSGEKACLDELLASKVDAALLGSLVGEEDATVASFKLVATKDGAVLGEWVARLGSAEALHAYVDGVAMKVRALLVVEGPRRTSFFRWVPVIMGGVALAGSIALYGYAFSEHRRLVNGDPRITSTSIAEGFAARGRSVETTAFVLGGVGLALIAGGVLFALVAPESDVRIGAAWAQGPVIAFSAVLP